MIKEMKPGDDMFSIGANVLINATNCKGIMGGGLARIFADKYPDMYEDYKDMCERGIYPGIHHTFLIDDKTMVLNFPTKNEVYLDSEEAYIKRGLATLASVLVAMRPLFIPNNMTKVAVPALGCGLGGLDWAVVRPMIHLVLSHPMLSDYEFYVFPPHEGKK